MIHAPLSHLLEEILEVLLGGAALVLVVVIEMDVAVDEVLRLGHDVTVTTRVRERQQALALFPAKNDDLRATPPDSRHPR